jgi:hypothetical protein
MSWQNIEGSNEGAHKAAAEARERFSELTKAYSRCFATEDGQKVVEDLTRKFLLDNSTDLGARNVEYEAAYHNGEAGVIRMIVHYIQQAEKV